MFKASYAKVERARQFIAELEAFAEDYKNSKPWTGKLVKVPGDLQIVIDKRDAGLTPSCIVGDAVHNLRTALDLMATELADSRAKGVYFPFAGNSNDLDDMIKQKRFDRCGPDAVALLKTFKPYNGGNYALRALHDFDIQDKHKYLIPTQDPTDFQMHAQYDLNDPESGTVDFIITKVRFAFPDDSAFPKEPIVETLKDLVQLVIGILEAFTGLVAARQ